MEGYAEGRTGFMDDLKGLLGMGQEHEDVTEDGPGLFTRLVFPAAMRKEARGRCVRMYWKGAS